MKNSTASAMANVGGDDKDSKIAGLTSGMASIVAHSALLAPVGIQAFYSSRLGALGIGLALTPQCQEIAVRKPQ